MESVPRPAATLDEMLSGSALATERASLGTQAVDRLRDLVVSGRLAPGTKLIQEQVAAELGVSRTPLREAIRVLVYEGLLTPIPSSGSVRVVELSDEDARELYEVRELIDGLAARRCASQGLTDERLTELRDLEARLNSAVEPYDATSFVATHARFHLTVLDASGNSRLQQLAPMVSMSAQMLFARLAQSGERMRRSASEHAAILDAIIDRDPERAEILSRAHIRAASDFWLPPDN